MSKQIGFIGKKAPHLFDSTTNDWITDLYALDKTDLTDLLPSQTGNAGKFITTNGTTAYWSTIPTGLQFVTTDSTLTGLGTPISPLSVVSGGGYITSVDNTGNDVTLVVTTGVLEANLTSNDISQFTNDSGYITSSTATPPAGNDTNIQFNNSGSFGGSDDFEYVPNSSSGYGQSDLYISSIGTETGIVLNNTSSGGAKYNIFVTGAGSGINAGAFCIGDITGGTSRLFIDPTGKFGINTVTPVKDFEVNGDIKGNNIQLTNGATDTYVLTSDATGNGSWQNNPKVSKAFIMAMATAL